MERGMGFLFFSRRIDAMHQIHLVSFFTSLKSGLTGVVQGVNCLIIHLERKRNANETEMKQRTNANGKQMKRARNAKANVAIPWKQSDCTFAIYCLFSCNFAEMLSMMNKNVAYTVNVTHQGQRLKRDSNTLSGLLEANGQSLVITLQCVVVFSYLTGIIVYSDDKVCHI